MSNDDQRKGIRPGTGSATGRTAFSSQETGLKRDIRPPVVSNVASNNSTTPPNNQSSISRPKASSSTAPDGSIRRAEASPVNPGTSGNTAVKSTSKSAADRVNTATKSSGSKGWQSRSTGSSTKTTAAVSQPSPISGRNDGVTQSTPSRVRFVQRKSPTSSQPPLPTSAKKSGRSSLGQPARISSQNSTPAENTPRRHSMHQIAPLASSIMTPMQTKSYKPLGPVWQQLDDEYEERMRIHKRDREGNMVGLVKRISSTTRRRAPANDADITRLDINDPNHVDAKIGPKLKLRIQGKTVDLDDDEQRYSPQPRLVNIKVARPQTALKKSAARKLESVDTSSDESDDVDDDKSMESSSEKSSNQVDELDSDQSDQEPSRPTEDVEMQDVEPPELFLLDSPPRITAPLPDISTAVDVPSVDQDPSDELIAAVEALTLSVIRMQKTLRLPFLLRNLRKGFLKRCSKMLVPIYPIDQEIALQVHYESAGGAVYQTEVSDWQCPLCDLLGIIKTREMLDCHLKWDHPEVYYEWHEIDDQEKDCWKLQLVIPEVGEEAESSPVVDQLDIKPEIEEEQTLATPGFSSPFPSVSLSPPLSRRSLAPESTTPSHTPKKEVGANGILLHKLEPQAPRLSTTTLSERSTTLPSTRRSQSTTATTTTASTSATARRPRSPTARYLTPPPPDNPLGPAAQKPYLPAKSDYDGPTVYYSCRPGGPCLFDILGTLPMEPFGLLDWEVLDREDEIYESDDVQEEYKVMHALWARWIVLNRNKFIANYYKGVISFIDDYWKIIHRAAGWDALRYFLFIFLANQFLNGHEVGQVLLHYEDRTGMEYWYN